MRSVAGVDEAGRGAWAGPLVAAAVALPHCPDARRTLFSDMARAGVQVNDSKILSARERELIVEILLQSNAGVAVASASSGDIDERGVGYINVSMLRKAALGLRPAADFVLSDAFPLPDFGRNQLAIVRGDRRSKSIALASCVAKVARDRLMVELDCRYPGYGFARHKGYGTAAHRAALQALGVTPIHRRSFAPVRALCHDA
jgi:ribonuclease HII